MRGVGSTFITFSFLNLILSAEFFIKNFQTFWEVKIDINRVNLTLFESYKTCSKVALKLNIFLAFIISRLAT